MILTLAAALLVAGVIELPPGETHLSRPMELPKALQHLIVRGNPKGSTLVLDEGFRGRAAIDVSGATDIALLNFTIRGNRRDLKSEWYLPPGETPFADYFTANGIVVRNSSAVKISGVALSQIRSFPVIVNASSDVSISHLKIEDSGNLNSKGRNNTSGGILLEQGVSRFEIASCSIARITGNAIWTHSYASAPRSRDGSIHDNIITRVARDAIQIGHATNVRVENNSGSELGYPVEQVDIESSAVAVALDSAGNVDHSTYAYNRFTGVNGQCIDLDGFHDGAVTGNSCVNNKPIDAYPALHAGIVFGSTYPGLDPGRVVITGNTIAGFAYGAVFLLGNNNRIEGNQFLDMNRAHCGTKPTPSRCAYALDQPDLLRAGIYLAGKAKNNVIRGNTITGFEIADHCIAAAPDVNLKANTTTPNTCRNTEPRGQ